jgi:hypothetical protein
VSTAQPTDLEFQREQAARRRPLRYLILLPALFGAFLLSEPDFSAGWAIFVGVAMVVSAAAAVAFEARRGIGSRAATELYATFQLDLTCLFATILAWRLTRSPAWVLAVFVGLLIVLGVAAFVWRRAVLSELIEPRTAAGKLLTGLLATTSAIGAAALGYAFGRAAGGWAAALVFLVIAYWLVLLRQAMWLKVEEPLWRPRRY